MLDRDRLSVNQCPASQTLWQFIISRGLHGIDGAGLFRHDAGLDRGCGLTDQDAATIRY
jgi:hypothetical protein